MSSETAVRRVGQEKHELSLYYIPQHRILLCGPCGYCVLFRALDRYLKVIHHLPTAERERHLNASRQCDLAELEDIIYPDGQSRPISGLPVYSGYTCAFEGCQHLCVARKRMQAHWRVHHNDLRPFRCKRAQIQTLFRGNSLRYFAVTLPNGNAPVEVLKIIGANVETNHSSVSHTTVNGTTKSGSMPEECTVEQRPTIVPVSALVARSQNASAPTPLPAHESMQTSLEWLLTYQFCEDSFVRRCYKVVPSLTFCASPSSVLQRVKLHFVFQIVASFTVMR